MQNDDNKEDKESFTLLAAVTSTWVPCIVGKTKFTLLTTGIIATLSKAIFLIIIFLTTNVWLQRRGGKIFMLWCVKEDTIAHFKSSTEPKFCRLYQESTDHSQYSQCLGSNKNWERTRICEKDDKEVVIQSCIFAVLIGCILASLLALIRLHRQSNWVTLMKNSRRCMMCIPATPFVHPAALFAKMQEGEEELDHFLSKLQQEMGAQLKLVLQNTTLSTGEGSYQYRQKENKLEIQYVLYKYGAPNDYKLAHEILAANNHQLMTKIGLQGSSLMNEEDDTGRTPLDIVLSGSRYPKLVLIASGEEHQTRDENMETVAEEVNDFVNMAAILLSSGAKLGGRKQRMNQIEDAGPTHWAEKDFGFALAEAAWNHSEADMRNLIKCYNWKILTKFPQETHVHFDNIMVYVSPN